MVSVQQVVSARCSFQRSSTRRSAYDVSLDGGFSIGFFFGARAGSAQSCPAVSGRCRDRSRASSAANAPRCGAHHGRAPVRRVHARRKSVWWRRAAALSFCLTLMAIVSPTHAARGAGSLHRTAPLASGQAQGADRRRHGSGVYRRGGVGAAKDGRTGGHDRAYEEDLLPASPAVGVWPSTSPRPIRWPPVSRSMRPPSTRG